jgi:hypothetical protein
MTRALWSRLASSPDDAHVFAQANGAIPDRAAIYRMVKAAGARAGIQGVGLHVASHVRVHPLPARLERQTGAGMARPPLARLHLATYINLLEDDLPDPDFLDEVIGRAKDTAPTDETEVAFG